MTVMFVWISLYIFCTFSTKDNNLYCVFFSFFLEEDLLISTNNIYRIVEKKGIRNTVRTIMRKERETNPRQP